MTVQDTIETNRQKHLKEMVANCAVCALVSKEFTRLNARIDEVLASNQQLRTRAQDAEAKLALVGEPDTDLPMSE